MISKLKLAAYAALIALAIWSGHAFHSSYSKLGEPAADPATNTAPGPGPSPKSGPTNQPAPPPPAMGARPPASNSAPAPVPPATAPAPAANAARGGTPVGYLAAFVGALAGLGLLITYDLTQFLGARAVDYLFDNQGEGERDPEYELAEQTWVNGKPLEAIEMMREYLKKNPRAQYAALRIAEIYEKDLRNDVAASLEYEEILRKKLPPERWGWAAIHLCNLYSRMGQPEKMRTLLERIARDYPRTSAAKKARHNLGLPEPQAEEPAAPAAPPPEPAGEQDPEAGKVYDLDEAIAAPDAETPLPPPEAAPEAPLPGKPPKSNLPPGFRKK
jgi:TolA-binding protein